MKKFLLFFGIIVLFACNEKPVKNEPKDNIDTPEQNSSEEKVVIETVKNFLYWYRDNYDKVNSYNIVPQSGDTIEDQYRIDYKEVDKYLDALNKSGYIATEFILKEKIFFKSSDSIMQAEKQTDGPPYALDSDNIFYTQDVDETLQKISEAKFENFKLEGDAASVKVTLLYSIAFYLKKENNKWKITDTEPLFGN